MNEPQPALLPCPFCGSHALLDAHADDCYFTLHSRLKGSGGDASLVLEAHAAWNRRTPSPVGVEPAGYALVPVEPTPEMLSEIWVHKNGSLSEAYRAMLAAAPQPVVREPLTDEAARKQGANHD